MSTDAYPHIGRICVREVAPVKACMLDLWEI